MQTKISTSTCKYAHEKRANAKTRKHKNAQLQQRANGITQTQQLNNAQQYYKRVIVKLVRLFSARPAAVSLVAIGSVLPNPL